MDIKRQEQPASFALRRLEAGDAAEWLRMRQALWPDHEPGEHLKEMEEIRRDAAWAVLIAARSDGSACGFLEAGQRKYAEGCDTSPVGYIEGWYVDEDMRRLGVGRSLVRAAEDWAREAGLQEMASDCLIDNTISLEAHLALGYEEVERIITFRKAIDPSLRSG